jgi:PAS domain S-box-containing protein
MQPEEDHLLDEFAEVLIAVTPNEGRVVYWSRGAEAVFGYARDEVLGRSLVEVLGPTKHSELRKTGGAKFQPLLEAAPDAAVIVDSRGNIALVNSQTEKLFGYTRSELIGKPVEILFPPHPGHRQPYGRDARARAMTSGLELYALRRNGTEFPVEVSLSSLETEEGVLTFSAIRDVTDRKKTEMALRIANAELEAFSYSVAHDLRAPLRGMNGFAQILLEEYGDKLNAAGVDYLNEIHDNALQMGALIDALLSLSHVSRAELKSQRIDLSLLARAAIERLKASEPERAVEVVVPPYLWAQGDSELARALVDNLLGNAWKFTSKTPLARIEMGAVDVDGVCTFFVRDNGAGFDMAHAAKLFAPFQRLHSPAEFSGTGVGLATVQRIVHRHSGRIWALGAVGEGATFYFTLPGDSLVSTTPEPMGGRQ